MSEGVAGFCDCCVLRDEVVCWPTVSASGFRFY